MLPQKTTTGKKTLLLVDDDTAFLQSASDLLTSAGYNVLQAAEGDTARRLLNKLEGTVDLLVVDLAIPDVNGFELIRLAARHQSQIKIFATTGIFNDLFLDVAQQLGAHASLPKPDLKNQASTEFWLKGIENVLADATKARNRS